jgi:hypothetical protein
VKGENRGKRYGNQVVSSHLPQEISRLQDFNALLFALIALLSSRLCAQVNQTGNIHGAVTDTSGAVIAGVSIMLSSPAALTPLTTLADSSGTYRFEQLAVGVYEVSATQSGFEKYVRQNIQISAGFSAEVNLKMTVGASTESITVSAAGPVVDTSSTTVGASVGAETIANELPVTRTMPEMVAIAPGVMPTTAPIWAGELWLHSRSPRTVSRDRLPL